MNDCKPVVVKLGGALLDHPAAFAAVVDTAAAMHATRKGSVVIVHGGGNAVDRQLTRAGFTTTKREGIRITPPDQMTHIASTLGGEVNQRIVGALLARGADAVGLSLADGHTAHADKATRLGFDAGRVGEIDGGNPRLLRLLLGGGFLPVISSIAMDENGELLNVNADDAAAAIASIAGASSLLFLTDVSGVLDAQGQLIASLTQVQAQALIEDGTLHGGMVPKIRSALETAQSTGIPVMIAGWRDPEVLARIAGGAPAGTVVSPGLSLSETNS